MNDISQNVDSITTFRYFLDYSRNFGNKYGNRFEIVNIPIIVNIPSILIQIIIVKIHRLGHIIVKIHRLYLHTYLHIHSGMISAGLAMSCSF